MPMITRLSNLKTNPKNMALGEFPCAFIGISAPLVALFIFCGCYAENKSDHPRFNPPSIDRVSQEYQDRAYEIFYGIWRERELAKMEKEYTERKKTLRGLPSPYSTSK